MQYIYEVFDTACEGKPRIDTMTRFEDLEGQFERGHYHFPRHIVHVYKDKLIFDTLDSDTDMALHREMLERKVWKTKSTAEMANDYAAKILNELKTDPINPPHYQGFLLVDDPALPEVVELQWLETINRMAEYQNHPKGFIAALKLQIRKYMDRDGNKDEALQDYEKGLWYMKYMVAYMKNDCEPIYVKDIDSILKR